MKSFHPLLEVSRSKRTSSGCFSAICTFDCFVAQTLEVKNCQSFFLDFFSEHLIADIYGMSDEEFILDDNYEIDCRRPSDPVPSLVERVGGHKRQATEAAVKDILKVYDLEGLQFCNGCLA